MFSSHACSERSIIENKRYDINTAAVSGSFSTPYFGQPFDEKTFDGELQSEVYIYVPDNISESISLVIDIEYDISFGENILLEEAELLEEHKTEYYKTVGNITLDRGKRHARRKFLAVDSKTKKKKRIFVKYSRAMTEEYYSGGGRPVTGMKVSWSYTSAEKILAESRYLEDNKHFLLVANIIHQEGVTANLEDLIRNITKAKRTP